MTSLEPSHCETAPICRPSPACTPPSLRDHEYNAMARSACWPVTICSPHGSRPGSGSANRSREFIEFLSSRCRLSCPTPLSIDPSTIDSRRTHLVGRQHLACHLARPARFVRVSLGCFQSSTPNARAPPLRLWRNRCARLLPYCLAGPAPIDRALSNQLSNASLGPPRRRQPPSHSTPPSNLSSKLAVATC